MKNIVKELNYDLESLESIGAIPFTLKKDAIKGQEIIAWTTSPRYFSEDMKDAQTRIDYVFDNAKKTGLDELVMPDQPVGAEVCHEITYDEIANGYKSDAANRDGTIWNVPKNYDSVFMSRETHYRIMEDFGRSISLVYPAADCAVVRMYDRKKDVIALTHSDIARTTRDLIGSMVDYMVNHFGSNKDDIMIFVGAFAKDGMIWDKYPPFAAENPEVWKDYIEQIDDSHYNIAYGDKIYDQLIESGISSDNIYFDSANTVKDNDFFSNNRFKLQNDREGRNLFGITFDSLPVFESQENDSINTRLK